MDQLNYHAHTLKNTSSVFNHSSREFEPKSASLGIVNALKHLKDQWKWSGSKIAHVLHLPANTFNMWLKNKAVPIRDTNLSPEMQAVIHLLAIHRSLEAMFEKSEHQRAWLSTYHPSLDTIPEDKMAESVEGLIFIRQYLDYIRGRGA